MADKKINLVFDISAETGKIKQSLKGLNNLLTSSNIALPKELESQMKKTIERIKHEMTQLDSYNNQEINPINTKETSKSFNKIFKDFNVLKTIISDIGIETKNNPNLFFPKEAIDILEKANKMLNDYNQKMSKPIKTDEYKKVLSDITTANNKLKKATTGAETASRDKELAEQTKKDFEDQLKISKKLQMASESKQAQAKKEQELVESQLRTKKQQIKLQKDLNEITKKRRAKETFLGQKESARDDRIRAGRVDTKIFQTIEQQIERAEKELETFNQEYTRLKKELDDSKTAESRLQAAKNNLDQAKEASRSAKLQVRSDEENINKQNTALINAKNALESYQTEIQNTSAEIQELNNKKSQLEASFEKQTFETLITELEKIGISVPQTERNLDGVKKVISSLSSETQSKLVAALNAADISIEELNLEMDHLGEKKETYQELTEQQQNFNNQVEQMKGKIEYFFGMANAIQLLKRAVRSAYDTVKELDAAMTETAVVTDFSVGDMWAQLPRYTEAANKLGTTTLGAYETMTLFYQQGLKTDEVFQLGTETMKMARIAGMDYAEATNLMTAALRGFNMELNQTSAQNINDVYSELAAITAADTNEIATAMTKTASIAKSANMEFETTAALLSQIIETTREPAETAGTALKTIIARFQELKKAPNEIGEIDGEIIDANKIEGALRSVGIALRDEVTGQFRDLDDVFLELASIWGTLDKNTQRYIATIAAGSRQQSRFIAMMSNYERTMELVSAANESAGASQKQFEKTLDSLESKLNRLKNAWNEYTMGLANNDAIKWAVDTLTKFLEIINQLTSKGPDWVQAASKIAIAFVGLKGAKGILSFFLKGITKLSTSKDKNKGLIDRILDLEDKNLFNSIGKEVDYLKTSFVAGKGAVLSFIKANGALLGVSAAVVAAIAAISVVVIKASNDFKEAQKEFKIDELNNQLNELGDQASKAKSSLKGITDSKKQLADLREEMNGLIKGTENWKQSLINVNEEILSIVEKYPSLQNFVYTDNDGVLGIQSQGWDELIAKQQELINVLDSTSKATNIQLSKLQKQKGLDDFLVKEGLVSEKQIKRAAFADSEAFFGVTWGEIIGSSSERFLNSILGQEAGGQGYSSQRAKRIKESGGFTNALYNQTTGFSSDDFLELATKMAEKGIYASDGFSPQEDTMFRQMVSEMGYSNSDFINELKAKTIELGTAFDKLGQDTLKLDYEQQKNERGFIGNAVKSSNISNDEEINEILTTLIDSQQKYDNLQEAIESERKTITTSGKELKELYANTVDGYYDEVEGKLYKDQTMAEEITLSDEALKNAIASANITLEIEQSAIALGGAVQGKNPDQLKLIKKLFSEEGNAITASMLKEYSGEENVLEKIAAKLDFDSIEQMATSFELSVEDLGRLVSKQFDLAAKRISTQQVKLVTKMTKNSESGVDYKTNLAFLEIFDQKFGDSFRNTLEGVFNSLEASSNSRIAREGYQIFRQASLKANTTEEINQVADFIQGIDWENPIEAVRTLNQEAKFGTGLVKEYAQTFSEVSDSVYGAGEQLRYFVTSADFSEIEQGLVEIIERENEIASSDIDGLLDDYKVLNDLLKNTGITAGGLAKILTSYGKGKITINQLTDTVLAAVGSFESLNELAKNTLKNLQEFEPGIDENEVASFMESSGELVRGNLDKGAYGNTQLKNTLDFLFGSKWSEGLSGNELVAEMERLATIIENNSSNMSASWEDLIAGRDYKGTQSASEVLEREKVRVFKNEEGEIELDIPEGFTTEKLVSVIEEAYGVSKNYAEMMVTDFKNYSTNISAILNANDYTTGIEKAYEKMQEYNGVKFIDQSELQTIAELTNKDVEQVKSDYLAQGDYVITNFFDENKALKDADSLVKELIAMFQGGLSSEKGQQLSEEFFKGFVKPVDINGEIVNQIDLNSIQNFIDSLPIPDLIKEQVVSGFIQGIAEASEKRSELVYTDTYGGKHSQTVEKGEKVQTAQFKTNADAEAQAQKEADALAQAFQDNPIQLKIEIEDDEEAVDAAKKQIEKGLEGIKTSVDVSVDPKDINQIRSSINSAIPTVKKVNVGVNLLKSKIVMQGPGAPMVFSINAYKNGLVNAKYDHSALLGEEGVELVQTKDGVYFAGQDGPQFANIKKGDTVYTHEQTKKILDQKGSKIYPRFAGGYQPKGPSAYGGANKNNGAGNSEEEKDPWENPFDKLYNLLRKINEELRIRQRIERRYEALLRDVNVNAKKIADNSRDTLDQLNVEKNLQHELRNQRANQINEYMTKNSDLTKYGSVTTNANGDPIMRINWDLINSITDSEQGEKVSKYINQLEEWVDEIYEVEDNLNDIQDAIWEIQDRGKDEYFDLEQTIKESIIKSYEREIEELETINESINDTNTKLIEEMERTINKMRQDRQNEKTEEELADKQRKLAYLQQDTSGANQLEILNLQKEIDENSYEYTNTLIDQKINELKEQNDKAAEQRQKQITIAQAQLDKYIETGELWNEAYTLMEYGIDENGIIVGSKLYDLLAYNSDYASMSKLEKIEWARELNKQIAQGLAYLEIRNDFEQGRYDDNVGNPDKDYKPDYGFGGNFGSGGSTQMPEDDKVISIGGLIDASGARIYDRPNGNGSTQYFSNDPIYKVLEDSGEYIRVRWHNASGGTTGWFKKSDVKAYANGGLADFTGPAWLDGTKAKPELILKPRDTENFIQLKDILASLLSRSSISSTENNGDNNYDIDINVESIGNDYDVEKMAQKIKSLINQDARYRNNNAINLMR